MFFHVIIKQSSCAELCFTSRYLTLLNARTVVKLYVCTQIVNCRERLATIRNVTLKHTQMSITRHSSSIVFLFYYRFCFNLSKLVGVEFNAPLDTVKVISEADFTANHLTDTDKQLLHYNHLTASFPGQPG